jgi:pyridoxal phosphate enzyme (YggS family)
LWKKAAALPDANWHLIGHLQRNKIEKTIPLTSLVHSVDSDRVLKALSEFGLKSGRVVPVLLEVNCSREAAKGGFDPAGLPAVGDMTMSLPGVRVEGLMTMAAFHDDPERCRPTFVELRLLRDALRRQSGFTQPWLSMGMSNDFEVAIEEGATHVRVGTTLFHELESV